MAKRDDDERPKRSWSEIDKLRDKAHSRGQSRDQRAQERVQRNPAYGQYMLLPHNDHRHRGLKPRTRFDRWWALGGRLVLRCEGVGRAA